MQKHSKSREETNLDVILGLITFPPIFILIPGVTVIACLGTLGWQIFSYLKSGIWQSISLVDGLTLIFQNTRFGQWLDIPFNWYGVHELISWLPLWVGLLLIGITIEIFWVIFAHTLLSVTDKNY